MDIIVEKLLIFYFECILKRFKDWYSYIEKDVSRKGRRKEIFS